MATTLAVPTPPAGRPSHSRSSGSDFAQTLAATATPTRRERSSSPIGDTAPFHRESSSSPVGSGEGPAAAEAARPADAASSPSDTPTSLSKETATAGGQADPATAGGPEDPATPGGQADTPTPGGQEDTPTPRRERSSSPVSTGGETAGSDAARPADTAGVGQVQPSTGEGDDAAGAAVGSRPVAASGGAAGDALGTGAAGVVPSVDGASQAGSSAAVGASVVPGAALAGPSDGVTGTPSGQATGPAPAGALSASVGYAGAPTSAGAAPAGDPVAGAGAAESVAGTLGQPRDAVPTDRSATSERMAAPELAVRAVDGQAPRAESVARAEPAPAPAPAPPPQPPLSSQLTAALARLKTAADGSHVMHVRVDPEDLGPIRVTAHIGAEGVRIELTGMSDGARDALRGALGELRRELAATGLHADLDLAEDGRRERPEQSTAPGRRAAAAQPPAPTPDPVAPVHHGALDLLA